MHLNAHLNVEHSMPPLFMHLHLNAYFNPLHLNATHKHFICQMLKIYIYNDIINLHSSSFEIAILIHHCCYQGYDYFG